MIPGIVASQLAAIPEFAGTALVSLDFINGIYFDGATVTAADVVDHPEWITASGLEASYDNESSVGDAVPHFIGNALTALLAANWTLVLEYEELFAANVTAIFTMLNADTNTWSKAFRVERLGIGDDLCVAVSDDDSSVFRQVSDISDLIPHGIGIHRIAVTRTDAKIAFSVDGGAVHSTATASSALGAINATIGAEDGAFLSNATNLRALTLYAPQADVNLPALSA